MTTLREAAQQALEAWFQPHGINYVDFRPYMEALRTALAESEKHEDWCASLTQMLTSLPPKPAPCNCKCTEPEQEPEQNTVTCVCGAVWEGNLMVHAPRQRKPLTEPELHEINPTWPAPGQHWDYEDVLEFVRAIERAHGIGGEA